MVVPAIFLNSSALLCVSPARLASPDYPVSAAAVAVEVTNNAAVGGRAAPWSTFSRSGTPFRYEAIPEIDSVFPHLGPASGNFSVLIAGGPFPETLELRCVYLDMVFFCFFVVGAITYMWVILGNGDLINWEALN